MHPSPWRALRDARGRATGADRTAVTSPSNPDWNRRVWALAGPIILSNVTVPLLGAVDTAVVGHLPDPRYIGGVAIGALIFNFVYWGFGFLRMGTTGPTAQAWGAGDPAEIRAMLARALLLAAGFGGLILLIQAPVGALAFRLLHASAEVEAEAQAYYAIRVWGAPAALANYVLLGWFLGLQNARWPLVLQIFMNGLNILLDLAFVIGLGWGVEGVAAATLIAEYAALALGLVLAAKRLGMLPAGIARARIFDGARFRRMLAVNRDIFIRTLLLTFSFALFTDRGAAVRRPHPGRQCRAAEPRFDLGLRAGWFRPCGRGAGRRRGGPPQPRRPQRRRARHHGLGRHNRAGQRGPLRRGRLAADRPADQHRGSPRHGPRLPALGGGDAGHKHLGATSMTASSWARRAPTNCATPRFSRQSSTPPWSGPCLSSGATTACGWPWRC